VFSTLLTLIGGRSLFVKILIGLAVVTAISIPLYLKYSGYQTKAEIAQNLGTVTEKAKIQESTLKLLDEGRKVEAVITEDTVKEQKKIEKEVRSIETKRQKAIQKAETEEPTVMDKTIAEANITSIWDTYQLVQ
jgi:hypothetical protein